MATPTPTPMALDPYALSAEDRLLLGEIFTDYDAGTALGVMGHIREVITQYPRRYCRECEEFLGSHPAVVQSAAEVEKRGYGDIPKQYIESPSVVRLVEQVQIEGIWLHSYHVGRILHARAMQWRQHQAGKTTKTLAEHLERWVTKYT